jgi:ABC-type xylose transport system substrate-binding protein
LGTQDTGQISVRENRSGNQDWTIKRHWQNWAHKTNKAKHNTTHKKTKENNTDSTINCGRIEVFVRDKRQFLPIIIKTPALH